jgi:hypothetical protein
MSILWIKNDLQTFVHFCLIIMHMWNKGTIIFYCITLGDIIFMKWYFVSIISTTGAVVCSFTAWIKIGPGAEPLEKHFWVSIFKLTTICTKVKASARTLGNIKECFFAVLEYFFTSNMCGKLFLDIWFPQESKVSPLLIVWIFLWLKLNRNCCINFKVCGLLWGMAMGADKAWVTSLRGFVLMVLLE